MAGQQFAKNFPRSMTHVNSDGSPAAPAFTNPAANNTNSNNVNTAAPVQDKSDILEDALGIKKYKTDVTAMTGDTDNNILRDPSSSPAYESVASSSKSTETPKSPTMSTFKNIGGLFRVNTKTDAHNKVITSAPLAAQDRKDLLQVLNEKLGISSGSKKS